GQRRQYRNDISALNGLPEATQAFTATATPSSQEGLRSSPAQRESIDPRPYEIVPEGLQPSAQVGFPGDYASALYSQPPCEHGCDARDVSPQCGHWSAGIELTFLQPRFKDNTAFTVMDGDGSTFDSSVDHEFNSDLELSPRVWARYETCAEWGWQVTWWQFDH